MTTRELARMQAPRKLNEELVLIRYRRTWHTGKGLERRDEVVLVIRETGAHRDEVVVKSWECEPGPTGSVPQEAWLHWADAVELGVKDGWWGNSPR